MEGERTQIYIPDPFAGTPGDLFDQCHTNDNPGIFNSFAGISKKALKKKILLPQLKILPQVDLANMRIFSKFF